MNPESPGRLVLLSRRIKGLALCPGWLQAGLQQFGFRRFGKPSDGIDPDPAGYTVKNTVIRRTRLSKRRGCPLNSSPEALWQLGLRRGLTLLHQHLHQHFFDTCCRAEGLQSRPVVVMSPMTFMSISGEEKQLKITVCSCIYIIQNCLSTPGSAQDTRPTALDQYVRPIS